MAVLALMLITLQASSASPDVSVNIVSSYTFAPDVNDKLKTISTDLITNELSTEISGAYGVRTVCFAQPVKSAYGTEYRCELYVTVLSATDWRAVTYRLEYDLDLASGTYYLKSVEPDVPLPSVKSGKSEHSTYSKGLADTPASGIRSAVIATKKINQYFKYALGSSTLLIGKKASPATIMDQLKHNSNLIAWNNIGHGNPYGLLLYNGAITSDDFCNMSAWAGLNNCVCFVNSCKAGLDPLKSCIIGGNGTTPYHGVQTYISGVVPLPIGRSDDTSREFWQHTLMECYPIERALTEAAKRHGLKGCYCLEGYKGRFCPPLEIKTIVSPASCVVRHGQSMTITAKSNSYVCPDTRVELYIYNGSSDDLVANESWNLAKRTKLLFKYITKQVEFTPGVYRIRVAVPECRGEDQKWFVVVPDDGKLDLHADAYERMGNTNGSVTGWVKPTRCRTFKVELSSNKKGGDSITHMIYQKTVPQKGYRWTGMLTGIYNIVIEYEANNGRTVRNRYKGKCALNYTNQNDWHLLGGSGSHWLSLIKGSYIDGHIVDWTRAREWFFI